MRIVFWKGSWAFLTDKQRNGMKSIIKLLKKNGNMITTELEKETKMTFGLLSTCLNLLLIIRVIKVKQKISTSDYYLKIYDLNPGWEKRLEMSIVEDE